MNKREIIDSIRSILTEQGSRSDIEHFHDQARLKEDLQLDSVSILNLIMSLELKHGLSVPDDALIIRNLDTIENFASELHQIEVKALDISAEYRDIKVHCLVSCLCEIIKESDLVDHRLFYIGVWDAELIVNDEYELSYHSNDINHAFFREWFETLYGVSVDSWYIPKAAKEFNLKTLISLVENKTSDQRIMAMIDLYQLPERKNKFSKNPFPHYVLLEPTDKPDIWFMSDPDFRWEGLLPKEKILNAINQPSVSGGYIFDRNQIRPTDRKSLIDYYMANLNRNKNTMTDIVREIVESHFIGKDKNGNELPLRNLAQALKELPVLAIRKSAYKHALAFFWPDQEKNEFKNWLQIINTLVETYTLIQYRAMKLAAIGSHELFEQINTLLDQQNEREFRLKMRLEEIYNQWLESQPHTTQATSTH